VLIDSAGQLGTLSSSRRFKNAIKPIDKASEAILALKPVTFHYKSDNAGTPQFGLIAEEVAEINPDLVVRDEKGEVYTVRYDAVNAMLLNEFLKEHHKLQELEASVAQERRDSETTITGLKKEMESIIARSNEQDSKIQKLSTQVELNQAALRTVADY
jgi:endosialidase-like protein